MKNLLIIKFVFLLFSTSSHSTSSFNIEVGQAESAYNQVKIDGKEGTLFNLRPALESAGYYRLSFSKKFKSPSGFRFLFAPLTFAGEKRFNKDINFNGVNFAANELTQARYRFNSYRGTYFREVVSRRYWVMRIGGTLKVRDAFIELEQNEKKKSKKNIGAVPLFYLYSRYKFENNLLITFDFDGLMAPQGRAFDVALMLGYYFSPNLQLDLGYRMLEGGADNEKVYNFSQVNYYFTAFQFNF